MSGAPDQTWPSCHHIRLYQSIFSWWTRRQLRRPPSCRPAATDTHGSSCRQLISAISNLITLSIYTHIKQAFLYPSFFQQSPQLRSRGSDQILDNFEQCLRSFGQGTLKMFNSCGNCRFQAVHMRNSLRVDDKNKGVSKIDSNSNFCSLANKV